MQKKWFHKAQFYHIYPLGFCGAPLKNDFNSSSVNRLDKIYGWIEHIKSLGANVLYLGPVFESTSHGYDTKDYYWIDRRLGDNESFKQLLTELHRNGIKVILDAVFNHVGRDFWAFKDLLENKNTSSFAHWFSGLNFSGRSLFNDPFNYEGWNGHYNLVKLNLSNPEVKNHLLNAVKTWIDEFDIDGLRLDAADCVDMNFLLELSSFTKEIKKDFFLVGEVIHGDYRKWVNDKTLDSVTNYECYKGLYSSLNDKNYFEIAYALNRQFGKHGMYSDLPLYNFVDNHDVTRIISQLKDTANIYPLYILLFTMPGIPSIYYGSEAGIEGIKTKESDHPLRLCIELKDIYENIHKDIVQVISRLSQIRKNNDAIISGSYKQIIVGHQQFVFTREIKNETVIVALNSSDKDATLEIKLEEDSAEYEDILNNGEIFSAKNGKMNVSPLWSNWARILRKKNNI
jgi:cyclomaltodextrinase / maltogenic alpha-amylase / neopullulanase